jgi:hypothetical protein
MSESKSRREVELLIDALDDEDLPDDAAGEDAVRRLNIDVKGWAGEIRSRVANARVEARRQQFALADAAYQQDLAKLAQRAPEPARSLHEQRMVLEDLIARAPKSVANAVHFHKFEEATSDELAEMIRSLRHLMGEDE